MRGVGQIFGEAGGDMASLIVSSSLKTMAISRT